MADNISTLSKVGKALYYCKAMKRDAGKLPPQFKIRILHPVGLIAMVLSSLTIPFLIIISGGENLISEEKTLWEDVVWW